MDDYCMCPWCRKLPRKMKTFEQMAGKPLSAESQRLVRAIARDALRKVRRREGKT